MKKIYIQVFFIFLIFSSSFADKFQLSKEDKLSYLNYATGAVIVGYGIIFWDYDTKNKFHASSEGWFEKDSPHGGTDKLGHLYVSYLSTHLYAKTYENWGYTKENALKYGVYSSFALTTIMEISDGFAKGYGFSYEDFITNILGTTFGYFTYKYPWLDEKIDYRIEYPLSSQIFKKDFATDYENMKYLLAFKASGFESLKRTNLKYLELYAGYYTRGYEEENSNNAKRELYFGIGINLSKLLNTKIFKYYQAPSSYLSNN